MSGFDNGTIQSGVFFQAKQFGSILRGAGPPVPGAGVYGDLYIDTQTWFLYEKREREGTDPWGGWLFEVPAAYRNTLKWFSASSPSDSLGVPGDYCLLWAAFGGYGLQPLIYGPKLTTSWAENGSGPETQIDPAFAGFVLPIGDLDEGTPTAFSTSAQLIAIGTLDEYILAIPVTYGAGMSVDEVGTQATPAAVAVNLNPLYTAEDEHAV